jgi:hypothetical protein
VATAFSYLSSMHDLAVDRPTGILRSRDGARDEWGGGLAVGEGAPNQRGAWAGAARSRPGTSRSRASTRACRQEVQPRRRAGDEAGLARQQWSPGRAWGARLGGSAMAAARWRTASKARGAPRQGHGPYGLHGRCNAPNFELNFSFYIAR